MYLVTVMIGRSVALYTGPEHHGTRPCLRQSLYPTSQPGITAT